MFSSHQLELVERICDVVTVVDEGRVVASGPIAALRAERSRPVVRVELAGGATNWAAGPAVAPGVRPEGDGGAVLVELADLADDQAVLDAARAAGRVVRTLSPSAQPKISDARIV